MDHDPAPQSLGDLAAAPQAVNGSAVLRERSGPPGDKRLARGSSRGAYGPSRQVRTALDDRQTFARVPRLTRPRRSAAHWAELCPESGPDGSRFSESIGPRLSVVVRCASGPCMGRVWGRGRGRRHTWHRQRGGGVSGKTPCVCQATICRFHVWLFVCFVVYRPRRDAPANTERTGATPTYLPLARLGEGGSVSHGVRHRVRHSPPPVGSLPSVCIPAGRLPGCAGGPGNDGRRTRPIDGAPCGRRSSGIVMDFRL